MAEVVGLLALMMLGLAQYAEAQTTVPHTFTADTTAKADEVNDNFSALATVIDSIPAGPKGDPGATGLQGLPGADGSPDTADQVRDKFYTGTSCVGNDSTDIMVKVGPLCVDVYEASVWDTLAGGGTQYGAATASDDYPCSDKANDCSDATTASNIFARSEVGEMPSIYITWFQAQQACANSEKRLLTNAEWQMAAAGTPDTGGADDGSTTCNTDNLEPAGVAATGSRSACVSNWGVYDMVGNINEWVADWVPLSTTACPGWSTFSDDEMCLSEASTTGSFPGALIRGGNWNNTTAAGVFALRGIDGPSFSSIFGFRCTR